MLLAPAHSSAALEEHAACQLMAVPGITTFSPLAVALSGGGDSLALLRLLSARFKDITALIVDHNLRQGSRTEARRACEAAKGLGVKPRLLSLPRGAITAGADIQNQARKARYAVLGEACRAENIAILVLGHTQDDQLETVYMRRQRSPKHAALGLSGMPQAVHAPQWPSLRGVTVVRPLLSVTRAALRDDLRRHQLSWSEDPSNDNMDFERVSARNTLGKDINLQTEMAQIQVRAAVARQTELARLSREEMPYIDMSWPGALRGSLQLSPRMLSLCLQSVGGSNYAPNPDKCAAILQAGAGSAAGAVFKSSAKGWLIARDPGAVFGRADGQEGLRPMAIKAGERRVWDNRFCVTAPTGGRIVPCGARNIYSFAQPLRRDVTQALPVLITKNGAAPFVFADCVPERLSALMSGDYAPLTLI